MTRRRSTILVGSFVFSILVGFGSAADSGGHLLLATIRHYQNPPRLLNVYHVEPEAPGPWACRPLVFIDTFESGSTGRWTTDSP
jgi:hypothetical protein